MWWALSRLFEQGLLYQGHKVVWWWAQGGTVLSAAEEVEFLFSVGPRALLDGRFPE